MLDSGQASRLIRLNDNATHTHTYLQQSSFITGWTLQRLFELPSLHIVHSGKEKTLKSASVLSWFLSSEPFPEFPPDVSVLTSDGDVRPWGVQVHVVQRCFLYHMVAPGEQHALRRLDHDGYDTMNNTLQFIITWNRITHTPAQLSGSRYSCRLHSSPCEHLDSLLRKTGNGGSLA